MAYNLFAEGDLDLFAWSRIAQRCHSIELFPIHEPGRRDAIGISLPSGQVDATALDELEGVIRRLWPAEVYDLVSGDRIASDEDLAALRARIGG